MAARMQRSSGERFTVVDMGGGFGVPLYNGEDFLSLGAFSPLLAAAVERYRKVHPWTERLLVESGRFLVAGAGALVTRVVDVKDAGGYRFVILDGGIHALGGRDGYFGARPTPMRVIRAGPSGECAAQGTKGLSEQTFCGPLCTPADRLALRVLTDEARPGDLAVFYVAGAYGLTASAGAFLSRGFPAEVMVRGGEARLIRPALDGGRLLAQQVEVSACCGRESVSAAV